MGVEAKQTAVITGGASGIGRALAERLAGRGVQIVLADIEVAALDETTAQLAAGGAEVLSVQCDVSDLGRVEGVRDAALERFGEVHYVFNNAGVSGGSAASSPPEIWDWVIGVNLVGVVNGVQTFLPGLLSQGRGHIINTASVAGFAGVPGMGPYCATKAAVISLSESLHHELGLQGSAVRCSVLCPGFVKTRIYESERNVPAGLEDWAQSEEARFLGAMARQAVEGGAEVSVVVEAVMSALDDGRFWILSHERVARAMVSDQLNWITAGVMPRFDLGAAGQAG
jgi:NAD(P)-dependent dehydrogenase (short-subunit alcohol dehydrogenase family)